MNSAAGHASSAHEPPVRFLRPRNVDVFEKDSRTGSSRARTGERASNLCVSSEVAKRDVFHANRLNARVVVLAIQVDVNRFLDIVEHNIFKENVLHCAEVRS